MIAELRPSDSRPAVKTSHQRPRGYAEWRPQQRTRALLEAVDHVLEEYDDHLPLTVRQIFYRLVATVDYPKTEQAYNRLAEHLVRARRARRISFDAIRDDGVVTIASRWHQGIEDFWDDAGQRARAYSRDRQAGQRRRIELWCEAAGMMHQLARIADRYSVPVFSAGGFASLTANRLIADRALDRDVPTVLLHVGDLDPSGESIFEAMASDAAAFVLADRTLFSTRIEAVRVALTPTQVADYRLPTAPPKSSDRRSTTWSGDTCQLEALAPDELAEIVEHAISSRMDIDVLSREIEAERSDRTQLLKALPEVAGA